MFWLSTIFGNHLLPRRLEIIEIDSVVLGFKSMGTVNGDRAMKPIMERWRRECIPDSGIARRTNACREYDNLINFTVQAACIHSRAGLFSSDSTSAAHSCDAFALLIENC